MYSVAMLHNVQESDALTTLLTAEQGEGSSHGDSSDASG